MAYLKFSRDKRGYEHFCLVQPSNRGKARPRLLYWFRTPPNIKVGRSPFAPEIQRALEAQNPDVAFDWDAIVHTPIPPPMEPERWRERRRVERALKAAETEEAAAIDEASETAAHAEHPLQVLEPAEEPEELSPGVAAAEAGVETDEAAATAEPIAASNMPSAAPAANPESGTPRQGRRRRRRRGRRKPSQVQGSGFPVPGSPVQASQVEGPEPDISESEEPDIQDPGEPGGEEP